MEDKKNLITIDGKKYKKTAFVIEDQHPAIGRILNIEGLKFKILDDSMRGSHRTGTYIAKLTEEDEERMEEYDAAVEELSGKLVKKIDLKRMVKENMRGKTFQEIKTGLFILKAEEEGEEVEEEHQKGCYNYNIHYKNQTFQFITGNDVIEPI